MTLKKTVINTNKNKCDIRRFKDVKISKGINTPTDTKKSLREDVNTAKEVKCERV